jgi:sugar phosphate permease
MQTSQTALNLPRPTTRPTRVRHVVLGLTVAAYMITYMDRVAMSAAAPFIRQELGFDLVTMGWLLSLYSWGYSLFQLPGGWLGDRLGPRRALALIVCWWSVFTSITGLTSGVASMGIVRFLFGVGEAGAFPIATRSLSRWMLARERGFAQGVTHAGSRLGGAITPVIVTAIIAVRGWRAPFFLFGIMGVTWAIVWFWYYRDTPTEHPSVNVAERDLIQGSIGGTRAARSHSVPWRAILSSRTVWIVSLMYFFYGYCLNVYLNWLPTYLSEHRHFKPKQMGFYASLPLLAGVVGNVLGGSASDFLAHRTGNLKWSRRAVAVFGFLLAAAAIVPATLTADPYLCVWFTCIAFFGFELTVGVSWAIPLDIGGDYAGSVAAVMNTAGNIGGAIAPTVLAYLVEAYGWNVPMLLPVVLSLVAAALFLKIDATRRISFTGSEGTYAN